MSEGNGSPRLTGGGTLPLVSAGKTMSIGLGLPAVKRYDAGLRGSSTVQKSARPLPILRRSSCGALHLPSSRKELNLKVTLCLYPRNIEAPPVSTLFGSVVTSTQNTYTVPK